MNDILEFGEVTGRENRDNEEGQNRRFLQVLAAGETDPRCVEFLSQAGEDSSPVNGSTVLLINVGGRWFAIAADDNLEPESVAGEKRLYSSQGGGKQVEIVLKANGAAEVENQNGRLFLTNSGDLELNGNADFAVAFTDLQAVMTAFAGVLNAEFATIAGLFANLGETYSPPIINIDLTPAKVLNVKLP